MCTMWLYTNNTLESVKLTLCWINPERGDAHGLKKLDKNRICDVDLSFVLLLCYFYQNFNLIF